MRAAAPGFIKRLRINAAQIRTFHSYSCAFSNTRQMAGREQSPPFDRSNFEDLMKRRFFYAPSFDIYGGISGLFDYGPPGCALQANLLEQWRRHFVIEEGMLEVDCTALTPHEILKTSGHVDKFADWMCKDPVNGEIFRADHLVEEVLEARLKGDAVARGSQSDGAPDADDKKKKKKKVKEIKAEKLSDQDKADYEMILAQIDNFDGPKLGELMKKYDIRNPTNNNELNPPIAFNLMFETSIGPTGGMKGYLRPETAQGQFLNFNKLYEYNNSKVPFASASIGKSFRNEISPRGGLLRVREFLMAEIEHFVDPSNKKHARFSEVEDIELPLLCREDQLAGKSSPIVKKIGEAVKLDIVDNSTLGYFMARIYLFLVSCGVDPKRLRFRQHLENEMAHYAADCWDAELHTSYGWIECVGCADRSAYDLTVHAKKTNTSLVVRESLPEPIIREEFEIDIERKKFGPLFKKDAKSVEQAMLDWSQTERMAKQKEVQGSPSVKVDVNGTMFDVPTECFRIEKRTRQQHVREYTPNVIEPSFGIGRILYALMEHSFWTRPEDVQRGVLSFPPLLAPIKVLLVPLSNHPDFAPLVTRISQRLRKLGVPNKVDDSSVGIGKRYSRNDELGTPFGITVDFQSVKDTSLTLRERDTTKQVRASEDEILNAVKSLCENAITWPEVFGKYGEFTGQVLD